jgi:hypothetical protein
MQVRHQTVRDIISTALYAAWGWWGEMAMSTSGETARIEELDEDGTTVIETHTFQMHDVAEACGRIIAGDYAIRPDLMAQVRTSITADPDIDADASDCILQLAVFGEIRYG